MKFRTKLLCVMKLTTVFLLVTCLSLSARTSSQTVSYSAKNAKLEQVFANIEKQTGYGFFYKITDLKDAKIVNVELKNVTLKEALEKILKDQSLNFSIEGNTVFITAKKAQTVGAIDNSNLLLPPVIPTVTVRGRVINEKGDPVGGVEISINGGKVIGVTDNNGEFNLINLPEDAILTFKAISIETFETKLNGRKELLLSLKTKISVLDEVQMIAYGTSSKRFQTGNTSTVKGEDISKQPVGNVLQALSGRMSGVQIIQANGMPGSPMTVQIRGQNSIAANNNPLYVVDGVPWSSNPIEMFGGPNSSLAGVNGNPLNALNPNDIESVDVLKDADATALYGSRAANGVVLITTKKSANEKTKLDLNFNMGAGELTKLSQTLDTKGYLQLRRTAFALDGISPTPTNAPDLLVWDTTTSTDWQKYFYGGTAGTYSGQASLSGGNAQTKFLIGAGIYQSGTVTHPDDTYQRSSVHFQLDHRTKDNKFQLSLNTFYSAENYLEKLRSTIRSVAGLAPNYPAFDNNGNINWTTGLFNNPFVNRIRYYKNNANSLNASMAIKWLISSEFQFKLNLGYNTLGANQLNVTQAASQNPSLDPKGSTTFSNQLLRTSLIEPLLSYQLSKGKHQLTVLAGGTYQKTNNNGNLIICSNYTSDALLESLSDGTISSKSSNIFTYKYLSALGRLTYQLNHQILINASFRRDGSSRFGPGHQFGNFYSVATGWIFSENNWIKKQIRVLSFGKLRGSYGTTGNDPNSDYAYLSTYQAGTLYGTSATLTPVRIANADFGWEENRKLEFALETGWWNNRFLMNVAWYCNRSDNQLVGYPLATTSGFSSYQANLNSALVQNKGWELDLTSANVQSTHFRWTSILNASFPKNELLSFPGIEGTSYASTYVVGYPLSSVQRYQYLGIDQSTGLAQVADINKDNVFSSKSSYNGQGGDYVIVGKTAPRYFVGLTNQFTWKNWQADIFLQYVNQENNNLNALYFVAGQSNANTWEALQGYWRNPGEPASQPKPTSSTGTTTFSSNARFAGSSAAFSDASFLRVKNIAISYNLPSNLIRKAGMSQMKFYIQGQNLITISGYNGYDPETLMSTGDIAVPPLKNFVVGIQCTF